LLITKGLLAATAAWSQIRKVLADRRFTEKAITPLGVEPVGGDPEEFATFLSKLIETWVRN